MAAALTAKRADARRNRERLLRSAREVLAERGLDVEIEEIAKRAKVGAGTIYHNYPSKEDLILEVAREMSVKSSTEVLVSTIVSMSPTIVRSAVNRTSTPVSGVVPSKVKGKNDSG